MAFQKQDLEDLRVGWQKVANQRRYGSTIYVFELHGHYTAVTNRNQGVGTLVETIHAQTPDDGDAARSHGHGPAEPHEYAIPGGEGTKI